MPIDVISIKEEKKKGVFHSKCDEKVSKQGDVYTSMTTFLSIKLRDPWIGVCMSLFLLFYDSYLQVPSVITYMLN